MAERKPLKKQVQTWVRKMTNWQRTQWARMGYPGLRHPNPKVVREFLKRKRRPI